MTIGQAHALMLLNAMIKWSLLPMIVILIVAIVQYTLYQSWWKDPIGFTVVFLEIAILVQVAPQDYGQFFVHSVQGEINIGFTAVILSMFVTLGLIARVIVWGLEWRRAGIRLRQRKARQQDQEPSKPAS